VRPEISRISPFSINETVQLFGEIPEWPEVYMWQPEQSVEMAPEAALLSADGWPEAELPLTPPAGSVRPVITGSTHQVLYARSPMSGVTVLWLQNSRTGQFSSPCLANLPEIWSSSGTLAVPGERLSLFGQHFWVDTNTVDKEINSRCQHTDLQHFPPRAAIRNQSGGEVRELIWGLANDQDMPSQTRHKADLLIPAGTPSGQYELRFHNGTGGAWGWSGPVSIGITERRDLIGTRLMAWTHAGLHAPDSCTYDFISEVIEAPADGDLSDSGGRIQAAIDRVHEQGGGVVLLKAGSYGITRTIGVKPGVILRGEGNGSTTLTVTYGRRLAVAWPPIRPARRKGGAGHWAAGFEPLFRDEAQSTPLVWMQSESGLEDIRVLSGPGTGCLVLVAAAAHTADQGGPADDAAADWCSRVFLNRVEGVYQGQPVLQEEGRWYPQYHGVVVFSKTREFTMWRCRIVAPLALNMLCCRHEQARILDNYFEVNPKQGTINTFIGSAFHSMIAENTFVHGKRSLMSQMGFSNNWVFQNRSIGVGRGTNGQEEYMSEFGDSSWYGRAERIEPDCVLIPELTDQYPLIFQGTVGTNLDELEHYLFAAKGRGLGQYRKITAVHNGRVQLAKPWTVLPDADTEFTLINATVHNLWINNNAENGGGLSQFIFGAGFDNIVAGHEMLNNGGISLWSFPYTRNSQGKLDKYGIVAFNQIVNNTCRFSSNQNAAIILWSKSGNRDDYSGEPSAILGNVIRGNVIAGTNEGALLKNQTFRYWMLNKQLWLNFNPDKVCGIEINGDCNLVEQNLLLGIPNGVYVRGTGSGNAVLHNRTEGRECRELIDETGRSLFVQFGS
jgi:hypothetical protein